MSASSSVVVSSSRKGKHSRSNGATLSSSSFNESGTISSGSQSALPANVDILTLDPDDAFTRFSIRDIQNIESNLQSTHDQLSSKLHSLVSERYRDMLVTANTLIEMSSSATNLVNRLDAVRQGVEKARAKRDGKIEILERHLENFPQTNGQENAESRLFAIATSTKLLAEAPDDIWSAIESASLDSVASLPARRTLQGQKLLNFKAASAYRAAWIFFLSQEAWKWLKDEDHEVDSEKDCDVVSLFPYIRKQWLALESMKMRIINVAHAGLEGWFASDARNEKRWEDVSTSYTGSITFLLSAALMEGLSITKSRDLLLQQRRRAIEKRLQQGKQSPTTTLIRLVRVMAETMTNSLRAFVIAKEGSTLPHLASIFETMSRDLDEKPGFPPGALAALSTLPSASVFVERLPAKVRHFKPQLDYQDAEDCKHTTVKVIQEFSFSIRAKEEASLVRLVDRLSTISSIGEAQIQLRESFDRCCVLLDKACPQSDVSIRIMVEQEIRALVLLLEGLLLRRLDVICQERTAELPAAVSSSISAALKLLTSSENGSIAQKEQHIIALERNPTKFLFDSDLTSSNLHNRLRIQTPLVRRVLLSVEEHARSLSEEMQAYAAYVQKDARKSAKRKQRMKVNTSAFANGHDGQMDRVLQSYRSAFDYARLALTDELDDRIKYITESSISKEDKTTQLLYLARIASAFHHSTVLQSKNAMSAMGSNNDFIHRLEKLRKVIDRLMGEIVKEATSSYCTKVKDCLDSRADQLGRPTPALVDCLMQIVSGISKVGCGYQSEISAIGRNVLSVFANSWMDVEAELTEQELHCYIFDSHAVNVLLVDQVGLEEVVSKLHTITSSLDDKTKEQIETALHRLRLILIPLCPLQSQARSQRKMAADGFTSSAPPLPMLSIIQGKEKVALLL